jgi:hypothetical protein
MDKINHVLKKIISKTLRFNKQMICLYGRITINKLFLLMIIVQLIFLHHCDVDVVDIMIVLVVGFVLSIICGITYYKCLMIFKMVKSLKFWSD